jgi:small-conductance mechanosensitive channel
MHLQDGPRDLSAQVAKVKRKARPWKAIISLILAIAAAVASGWAHRNFHDYFSSHNVQYQIIAAACAVAFCVFGSAATIGLAAKARSVLEPRSGPSHAGVVRYFLLLIGGFTTLIVTLVLFDVPVANLLLGGALTSVFVGIAAQQALGNVFAGIVLLLARPFRVGDAIRLRAGALGGEIDGTVTDIGITYVRLDVGGSVVSVPNSQVLNAVVGPQPRKTQAQPQTAQPQTAQSQPAPAGSPAGSGIDGTAAEKRVRSEALVAQGGDDQVPPGPPKPPGTPG